MRCRACGGAARFAFEKDGDRCFLCPACGSLTRPFRRDLEARYEGYLPPATLALPPATRRRYAEMLAPLEPFGRGGSMRLLDVGAGAGLLIEVARDLGWDASGTELSRAAAEAAARRGLEVRVGPLADLDLAPDSFDAVVSLETVEHVPDPTAFLREVAALLHPGGGLLLTTPNYGALSRRLLGREWLAVSRDHICLLTPRALAARLRAAGFERVTVTSRTFLVNEALKRFRRGTPARRRGFLPAETAALQEGFEARPALRLAKRAANAILARTGLGDVLVATAVRGARP